ncbi:MAG: ARMT1-like domain-containing protein, partial [Chlorobiales bacterium]|nr:ARMT1-like domain-containing protein [Chlorobiales bacterium]
MLITPDCISCVYNASLAAVRELTADDGTIKELMSDIMQIPAMQGLDWEVTSPEVLELTFKRIAKFFNTTDPFKTLKARQNRKGLELYPWLRELVAESDDSLRTALNLAIIGNSLDVMWTEGSADIEPTIRNKLKNSIPSKDFAEFRRRLEAAKHLVYLGDNSGEIVFDRVFIETIKQLYDIEIVFVVRSVPALNDATMKEARLIEMDSAVTLIENGIDGPLPGTLLTRCSAELRELIDRADLIISKGGGNFDTLEHESWLHDKIVFMLMCKCVPYQKYFHTAQASPVFWMYDR